MLTENDFVAVSEVLSVTWTVTLNVPPVVGVPLNTPDDAFKVKPGTGPLVINQVYGAVPPEADNCCEYEPFTTPDGSGDGVVMVKLDEIVIVNDLVAVTPLLSVTCTVKEKVPLAVGLPLIPPVSAPSVKPVGRAPAVTTHGVYGLVPPAAVRVTPYGVPMLPFGRVGAVTMVRPEAIVMVKALVVEIEIASVTCAVNVVPEPVGVPLMVDPVSNSPLGSWPEMIDHV
jgi:hypothetical protein